MCFGFPFIFCCHSCIRNAFVKLKREEALETINGICYNAQPVLSISTNNSILVNTEWIAIRRVENPLISAGRPMSTNQQSSSTQRDKDSTRVHDGSAVIEAKVFRRSMTVKIPEGVTANMVISVQSPDGVAVQVTVPEGVQAGQDIDVQY
jgi:hypothetical protein